MEHADTATLAARAMFPTRGPIGSHGALGLHPQAFGWLFFEPYEPADVEQRADGVAIVRISGPLEHHRSFWCDSYDAIRERFDAALAAKPTGILLCIDSPGGLVSGCFELAEHMRSASASAGVPLYAYTEGMCASAAYALASAASRIGGSAASLVGSIGVIDALIDATALDQAFGVRYRLITSGARKADGNPHQPTDEAAIVATQQRVNDFADLFFSWVSSRPGGISADAARALEANIFVGARALSLGLLDQLGDPSVQPQTLDRSTTNMTTAAEGDDKKSDSDLMGKLRKLADAGDEEAKKMLGRLESDDADDAEAAEPSGDEPPAKEPDGDEKAAARRRAAASASAQGAAPALEARLAELERVHHEAAQRAVAQERAALLAQRPDFDEPTRNLLAAAPIDQVRSYVASAPRRTAASRAASMQPSIRPGSLTQPTPSKHAAAGFSMPTSEAHASLIEYAARRAGASSARFDVGAVTHRAIDGRPARTVFGVDVEADATMERKVDRMHRGRNVAR